MYKRIKRAIVSITVSFRLSILIDYWILLIVHKSSDRCKKYCTIRRNKILALHVESAVCAISRYNKKNTRYSTRDEMFRMNV